MGTIRIIDKVKYTGETNYWTFRKDLNKNSRGTVKNIIEVDGKSNYEIELDNGIITTIEEKYLELNNC